MGVTGPPPKPQNIQLIQEQKGNNMATTSGGKSMDDKCKKGGFNNIRLK